MSLFVRRVCCCLLLSVKSWRGSTRWMSQHTGQKAPGKSGRETRAGSEWQSLTETGHLQLTILFPLPSSIIHHRPSSFHLSLRLSFSYFLTLLLPSRLALSFLPFSSGWLRVPLEFEKLSVHKPFSKNSTNRASRHLHHASSSLELSLQAVRHGRLNFSCQPGRLPL